MKTIGFIGCGNMGKAMVEGIMKAQLVDGDHMIVSNQHPEKLETLSRTYDLYIRDSLQCGYFISCCQTAYVWQDH